jgi:hypothetical protein
MTILEGSRFSFGGITYDLTDRARMIDDRVPFDTGGKTGAASSSQTRPRDLVNNFVRTERSGDTDGARPIRFQIGFVIRIW